MKKSQNPFNCDLNDRTMFLKNEEMYLGLNVMTLLQSNEFNSNKEMLEEFYDHCRQFLKIACEQIRKRYIKLDLHLLI